MPSADVFALTPICPHALSNRSIIMPLSATIRVKAVSSAAETVVNADGRMVGELGAEDELTIRRSRRTTRIMHLASSSFFEALSRKLHWRGTYL
jgi:NAD+ kinase